MPRATLTFTLPDERHEFEDATRGADWRSLVMLILDELRTKLKHGNPPADAARAYESVREIIYAELGDLRLSVDD